MLNLLLMICSMFYAVLCIFSIVTGLMYAGGKKKLNPIELSDRFMSRYSDQEKIRKFTMKMGWVTFAIGILQGIASFAIYRGNSTAFYGIALGFTLFSILSVALKLRGKVSAFPILKGVAYVAILIVLLLPSARTHFGGQ